MNANQFVIIPSLNPDDKLVDLVKRFVESDFVHQNIIVVNDGSSAEYDSFFQATKDMGVTLLTHTVNQGKGQALKTAFSYLLDTYKQNISVVCADADGQHAVADVIACIEKVHPNTLVLGCRQFDDKDIPLRSRFGNKLTRTTFRVLCGVGVSDTQTGLRAMDSDLMRQMLLIDGKRFEYEMNMLIETKDLGIKIVEVPIKTIYIEDNKTSHFNPLKDSLRIYKVFAKFMLSSALGFFVDITLFAVAVWLLDKYMLPLYSIIIANVGARIISSLTNYLVNKYIVFRGKAKNEDTGGKYTALKYFSLCVVQISISTVLVWVISTLLPLDKSFVKIVVDAILFVISFQIQREWVFKK